MNPWTDAIPDIREDAQQCREISAELPVEARLLGVDSALRRTMRQLDGETHQAQMRAELRLLALAGFIPERGYKKAHAFNDAVELMKELARNAR